MKKKRNKKNWIIFISLILTLGTIGVVGYLVISNYILGNSIFTTPINNNRGNLTITPLKEEDDYVVTKSDFLKINYDSNYIYSNDVKEKIDQLNNDPNNWLKEEYFSIEKDSGAIEYTDPILGIKFRDYSYGSYVEKDSRNNEVINQKRYLLKQPGLALLANYFYARQSYGPEAIFLDSVNINDSRFIDGTSKGVYYTNSKRIYISTPIIAEKGFTIAQKVKDIFSTLFHEYTHHWANCYVDYAPVHNAFTKFTYRTEENPAGTESYFYSDFVNLFKFYLNYEKENDPNYLDNNGVTYNGKLIENSNFVGRLLNTKDLFDLGNTNDNSVYKELLKKLKILAENSNNKITFKPNNREKNSDYAISSYEPDNLAYYYSIIELIPREWIKYAYIPFYDSPLENQRYNINYFQGKNNFKIFQNYYGSGYLSNGNSLIFSNDSYVNDWSRVFSNGIVFSNTSKQNFKNNLWAYELVDKDETTGKETSRTPLYKLFYKLFLESMGYGKVIAQMKNQTVYNIINGAHSSFSIKTDEKYLNNMRLTGYLPSNDFKGLVYSVNGKKVVTKINYIPIINFRGLNKPIKAQSEISNAIIKPNDILDDLPQKYISYYTDYFRVDSIDKNSSLSLWKDWNNDEIIQDNELVTEFNPNPLPKRPVINSDAEQNTYYKTNSTYEWISKISDPIKQTYQIKINTIN